MIILVTFGDLAPPKPLGVDRRPSKVRTVVVACQHSMRGFLDTRFEDYLMEDLTLKITPSRWCLRQRRVVLGSRAVSSYATACCLRVSGWCWWIRVYACIPLLTYVGSVPRTRTPGNKAGVFLLNINFCTPCFPFCQSDFVSTFLYGCACAILWFL